jgi:hypothetical protein
MGLPFVYVDINSQVSKSLHQREVVNRNQSKWDELVLALSDAINANHGQFAQDIHKTPYMHSLSPVNPLLNSSLKTCILLVSRLLSSIVGGDSPDLV